MPRGLNSHGAPEHSTGQQLADVLLTTIAPGALTMLTRPAVHRGYSGGGGVGGALHLIIEVVLRAGSGVPAACGACQHQPDGGIE